MPRLKLRQRAEVQVLTPGGVWQTVAGAVPCVVQGATAQDFRTEAGNAVTAGFLIFGGPNPVWGPGHRLLVDGVGYVPMHIDADVASRGHHSETIARLDTEGEIAADPTVVAVKRAGATLPGTITVRIVVEGVRGAERRGAASQATVGAVTVVATAGTDLRKGDLLQAEGGAVYRVTFVAPGQRLRVEADGEVAE